MTVDFPYDLVGLQDFEAGWGWDGQLRGLIRKKYRHDLEGLTGLEADSLARRLGAELVPQHPYATIQWVMCLRPFRPLEIFFLYNLDPEFGCDLRCYYARKSLVVPTEDAYVFTWDFLGILARYGRRDYSLDAASPGSHWVSFAEIEARAGGSLKDFTLGLREEFLQHLPGEIASTAVLRMDSGIYAGREDHWAITWLVLPDLLLRLTVENSEVQVGFDDRGAAKYSPEFLLSFTWLYLNALIREARQVEPKLTRLSRYF